MRSVIYISSATSIFDKPALDALIQQCRAYNSKHDITGCLAYNGVNFLQLIEGPEEAIETCLERIIADSRHDGIVKIRDEAVGLREFPDWTMAGRLTPDAEGRASRGLMLDILQGARQATREIFEGFATLKSA
ncbi:BLUF domain-containing protein [Alterisphingorhabdus coralli]|uniref:BLUF domain-containing protein n=1 Tax=Alterisphingorhabdus coralli TaxID=3071408 RepID=A0AA97HZY3_9SPHN|nr:BLUF domain-containing protein [Parasphingorhabdus sp. SCSIO 66989]WOE75229.1 BLUF domain-containing protein [Parasphingorhabdus sp. SCSIO 66989]